MTIFSLLKISNFYQINFFINLLNKLNKAILPEMSDLFQSTFLSLENNLLQLNITQNLFSEKTAKILDITKSIIYFHNMQIPVNLKELMKSQFGLSTATKQFEETVRADLKQISETQKLVLNHWEIFHEINGLFSNANQKDEKNPTKPKLLGRGTIGNYGDQLISNLTQLKYNLKKLVKNQIKSLNLFIGECQRSVRGLGLIIRCMDKMDEGESFQ